MPKVKLIFFLFLLFVLNSCSNPFHYDENKWVLVTQSTQGPKSQAYIDTNRLECKDGKCRAWVKLEFVSDQPIAYSGKKKGEKSGFMLVNRVDSSVDYDCKSGTLRMNSYQLYDRTAGLIDTKWVQSDLEYARPGTVHYDILKKVCEENAK